MKVLIDHWWFLWLIWNCYLRTVLQTQKVVKFSNNAIKNYKKLYCFYHTTILSNYFWYKPQWKQCLFCYETPTRKHWTSDKKETLGKIPASNCGMYIPTYIKWRINIKYHAKNTLLNICVFSIRNLFWGYQVPPPFCTCHPPPWIRKIVSITKKIQLISKCIISKFT